MTNDTSDRFFPKGNAAVSLPADTRPSSAGATPTAAGIGVGAGYPIGAWVSVIGMSTGPRPATLIIGTEIAVISARCVRGIKTTVVVLLTGVTLRFRAGGTTALTLIGVFVTAFCACTEKVVIAVPGGATTGSIHTLIIHRTKEPIIT